MSGAAGPLVCFSDIDGTLVHYPETEEIIELQRAGGIILLPPSTTGRVGIISEETLRLAARLRGAGARLAIVSGARTPTVLQRLPFLPAADAIVSENGGRIFYPDPDGLAAAPLKEDLEWRAALAPAAGPPGEEALPPERRSGAVWGYYRQLAEAGWKLDALGYATAFRLTQTPGKSAADLEAAIAARPPALKCSFNLGVADFYPAASGKEGAAARLLARWGGAARAAVHLGDDDNDLPLARLVGRAFLPSISEESVAAAVAAEPGRFVVADQKWTAGTEQMLRAVARHFAAARGAALPGAARAGSAEREGLVERGQTCGTGEPALALV
ncbi:MAG: hypothetical protein J3K34DRAFT_521817 [Monoraphidium minutum]|nr:MAG: hypothetical protein J3K34DRAFT_521817 [Monoraphidium minutum]